MFESPEFCPRIGFATRSSQTGVLDPGQFTWKSGFLYPFCEGALAGKPLTVETGTGYCTSGGAPLMAVCGPKIQEKIATDDNRKPRRSLVVRAMGDGVTAQLKRHNWKPLTGGVPYQSSGTGALRHRHPSQEVQSVQAVCRTKRRVCLTWCTAV